MLTDADPAGGVWRTNIDTCIHWVWVFYTCNNVVEIARSGCENARGTIGTIAEGVAAHVTRPPVKRRYLGATPDYGLKKLMMKHGT